MSSASVLIHWPGTPLVLAITQGTTAVIASLPGGRSEPNEPPLETAYRELAEETGILLPPAEMVLLTQSGTHFTFRPRDIGNVPIPPRLMSRPFEGVCGWYMPRDLVALSRHPDHTERALVAARLL